MDIKIIFIYKKESCIRWNKRTYGSELKGDKPHSYSMAGLPPTGGFVGKVVWLFLVYILMIAFKLWLTLLKLIIL